jgi:hypothetical protein
MIFCDKRAVNRECVARPLCVIRLAVYWINHSPAEIARQVANRIRWRQQRCTVAEGSTLNATKALIAVNVCRMRCGSCEFE